MLVLLLLIPSVLKWKVIFLSLNEVLMSGPQISFLIVSTSGDMYIIHYFLARDEWFVERWINCSCLTILQYDIDRYWERWMLWERGLCLLERNMHLCVLRLKSRLFSIYDTIPGSSYHQEKYFLIFILSSHDCIWCIF